MTADESNENTSESQTEKRGPNRERTQNTNRKPAKTDEPVTEQIFGQKGVRLIHFLIYTCVFSVLFVLTDILFASISTLLWTLNNAITVAQSSEDGIVSTIKNTFFTEITSIEILLASILISLLLTVPLYYINEIRYNRGEWIRTFI